jgi:alpha-mannosidase
LAKARLAPLLACINGTLAPEVYAIGHSHIDIAWMWPRAETDRKALRTLSTQLALMDEYPEYRFLQSQPYIYASIKKKDPELYTRIKAAVGTGKLIPEGGMWVEPDVNLISGESLIRQMTHGKRFFRDEFGVDSKLLWLPDVFGYTPALPQIMQGCGLEYFVTAKLQWGEALGDPFPYDAFIWEGLDGSRVCAYSMPWLGSEAGPKDMHQRWTERRDKAGVLPQACNHRLRRWGRGSYPETSGVPAPGAGSPGSAALQIPFSLDFFSRTADWRGASGRRGPVCDLCRRTVSTDPPGYLYLPGPHQTGQPPL